MQSRLYQAGWKVLDVLFPPSCAACGKLGDRLCPACFAKIQIIQEPICQICGDLLYQQEEIICSRCRSREVAFTAIRSWAVFEDPLQDAIHKLKYHQDRGLGEILAKPLTDLLDKYHWKVNSIVPVPLDKFRHKERGYNQSALLAKPISWETGIPYSESILIREKITRQQVGLSKSEREANMAGAFKADKELAAGKAFLVVDDVITTGSTINACAKALIKAGASKVFGLTLARSAHI